MKKSMRLFIAIPLSDMARKEISRLIRPLKEKHKYQELHWTHETDLHITITFLGEQKNEDIPEILESIKQTTLEIEEFEISASKILFVPKNKQTQLLWMALSINSSLLIEKIKNKLDEKLSERGVRFKKESKRFNGHITLARIKDETLSSLPQTEIKINLTVSSLALIESNNISNANHYTPLSVFPFARQNNL